VQQQHPQPQIDSAPFSIPTPVYINNSFPQLSSWAIIAE
jgi:hypothetical protein